MTKQKTPILTIVILLTVSGCAWLEPSEHIKIVGDYEVGWNDLEWNRSITKADPTHGDGWYNILVGAYVYSVGHNDQFIYAKAHPDFDTKKIEYFIIDIVKNDKDVKKGIYGPLDEDEFKKLTNKFGVLHPKFDLNFSESPWIHN